MPNWRTFNSPSFSLRMSSYRLLGLIMKGNSFQSIIPVNVSVLKIVWIKLIKIESSECKTTYIVKYQFICFGRKLAIKLSFWDTRFNYLKVRIQNLTKIYKILFFFSHSLLNLIFFLHDYCEYQVIMMVIETHRCRNSIGYRSELLMIFAVILKVNFF